MFNRLAIISFALFAALGLSAPATAAILDPVVEGNTLSAEIALGAVDAELKIEFEQVVGLSVENLGLSAELVNPADLSLLSRLNDSVNVSLAGGFPVLLKIQPPADGGLSFSGIATIELYTHNLQYVAGTPLRLFSAPDGGVFEDITRSMSSGSYRVRGSKGTFSEFLIVADLRPTSTVIDKKFADLSALLYAHSSQIDGGAFSQLESQMLAAESAWDDGDVVGAIAGIETFAGSVKAASAGGVPNVWRSSRDLDNVAGLLRAKAATLRFSLTLASNNL